MTVEALIEVTSVIQEVLIESPINEYIIDNVGIRGQKGDQGIVGPVGPIGLTPTHIDGGNPSSNGYDDT
jgi:hypothetical protein